MICSEHIRVMHLPYYLVINVGIPLGQSVPDGR